MDAFKRCTNIWVSHPPMGATKVLVLRGGGAFSRLVLHVRNIFKKGAWIFLLGVGGGLIKVGHILFASNLCMIHK